MHYLGSPIYIYVSTYTLGNFVKVIQSSSCQLNFKLNFFPMKASFFLPAKLCHVLLYTHFTRVLKVILLLLFGRRDRLWIAMEFCGGGSLQDIYHGT